MYHSKEGCSPCGKGKSKTRFQTVRHVSSVTPRPQDEETPNQHKTSSPNSNLKICGACRALFKREQNNLSVRYLSLYICIWWFHS